MVVENAVHTRQSSIYTTKHLFNTAGCIQRFIERTSFTISRSFISVTVACTGALFYYGITLTSGWVQLHVASPDTRVPASGPGQLSAQVRGSKQQPIRGQFCQVLTNQRRGSDPAQGPGIRGTKRVFKARPGRVGSVLMVSVTTLQKLTLTL